MAKIAKEVPFCAKVISIEGKTVTFKYRNGLVIVFEMDKLSQAMKDRYCLHGMAQKGGDAYSQLSKTNDYKTAFNKTQAVVDAAYNDAWSVKGDGGSSDLAAALVRLGLADGVEEAEGMLEGQDEEERKEILADLEVKAALAAIRAERAAETAKASAGKSNLAELLKKKK